MKNKLTAFEKWYYKKYPNKELEFDSKYYDISINAWKAAQIQLVNSIKHTMKDCYIRDESNNVFISIEDVIKRSK